MPTPRDGNGNRAKAAASIPAANNGNKQNPPSGRSRSSAAAPAPAASPKAAGRPKKTADAQPNAREDALAEARDMNAAVQSDKTPPTSPEVGASSSLQGNKEGRQSGRGERTAAMELNSARAEAAKLAAENERLKSQMEKDKERKRKEKDTAPEPPPPPKKQAKGAAVSRKRQVADCPCRQRPKFYI